MRLREREREREGRRVSKGPSLVGESESWTSLKKHEAIRKREFESARKGLQAVSQVLARCRRSLLHPLVCSSVFGGDKVCWVCVRVDGTAQCKVEQSLQTTTTMAAPIAAC